MVRSVASRHASRVIVLIVTPSNFSVATPAPASALFDWAASGNGQQITDTGQCGASLLPHDDDVVLVLPPRAVSWHRVALPKVAANRLRAALDGLLEDRLLTDVTELHFALEPGGKSGQAVWVAACNKVWLRSWLQILEGAGRPVSRIAPAMWPLAHAAAPLTPSGASRSFELDLPAPIHWAHHESGQAWLASASVLGVICTPLLEASSSLGGSTSAAAVKALMPPSTGHPEAGEQDIWLADPGVAAVAERVLNQRFELVALPQWLLRCAQSDWNLAQFDLSLSAGARRGQRWRRSLRRWLSAPEWRPARWGVAALVVVHLVGLNTAAWHERSMLAAKQQAVRQALQQAFPQVTLVLDAPVQMQRELARLQQASGMLSSADLETLLGAIDQASGGQSFMPATIAYTPGDGRFSGWRATEDQLRALQQALERGGWRVRFDGNELSINPPAP
ncbi:type II secretion system protein GspL [Hydrogenophaga sp.]|uniref:type II secretion system protein GspL n=1 Tax=Hydrogenophaga sp. TaxID=1904254 RepID=UPI00272EF992|nr:type II secretion system protein GspL [Hydrogenophaga sp.]MDP2017733.1 type II secretion system protein GspL [Hydrogenophaga sp.]MDP3811838.1 type II secretion system protein GspL [Hydrogenophaga sp.]